MSLDTLDGGSALDIVRRGFLPPPPSRRDRLYFLKNKKTEQKNHSVPSFTVQHYRVYITILLVIFYLLVSQFLQVMAFGFFLSPTSAYSQD